jgi:hypothetical protein
MEPRWKVQSRPPAKGHRGGAYRPSIGSGRMEETFEKRGDWNALEGKQRLSACFSVRTSSSGGPKLGTWENPENPGHHTLTSTGHLFGQLSSQSCWVSRIRPWVSGALISRPRALVQEKPFRLKTRPHHDSDSLPLSNVLMARHRRIPCIKSVVPSTLRSGSGVVFSVALS